MEIPPVSVMTGALSGYPSPAAKRTLSDVYLYDNGKVIKLTAGDRAYQFPMLNDKGQIVWQGVIDDDTDEWGVYYYDISSGVVSSLSNSKDGWFDVNPQLGPNGELLMQRAGNTKTSLVEMSTENAPTGGSMNQVSSGSGIPFDETLYEKSFYIRSNTINSGGVVVYADGNDQIVVHNGGDTTISANSTENAFPEINDNGQVVFEGYDGSTAQIYLYSGGKTVNISGLSCTNCSDAPSSNRYPHINSSGQVVWQGTIDGSNQILLYDGNQVRQISDTRCDNILPLISDNGDVAWVGREQRSDGWHYTKLLLAPAHGTADVATTTLARAVSAPVQNVVTSPRGSEEPPVIAPTDVTRFSFVVFGDSRGDNWSWPVLDRPQGNWDFIQFMVNLTTGNVNGFNKPDFVVFLGDTTMRGSVGNTDYIAQWKAAMDGVYKANIPVYLAKGNHELYRKLFDLSHDKRTSYYFDNQADFKSLFSYLPSNGPTGDDGYNSLAYSFVYGNSYFMFLDSFYCYSAKKPGQTEFNQGVYEEFTSPQIAWEKRQLATNGFKGAKHLFVLSHVPLFSDEGVPITDNLKVLAGDMDDNKFDFYLGAHEHLYSEKRP